jgi:hypothetical protein
MRPLTTNKNSPEVNTPLVRIAQKNVFNCIIVLPILLVGEAMNLSPLVEALKEFDEFAFTDTPLAADLEESGRTVTLNHHAVQRSLRHLQQLSGFLESQKTQWLNIIFHRRYKPIEQCQCHHPFECSRPFTGKSSSLRSQRDGTEVVLLSLVASTHEKHKPGNLHR